MIECVGVLIGVCSGFTGHVGAADRKKGAHGHSWEHIYARSVLVLWKRWICEDEDDHGSTRGRDPLPTSGRLVLARSVGRWPLSRARNETAAFPCRTPPPRISAPIYTSYRVPRTELARVGKNPNVHVVPHTVVTTDQPSEPCYGHGAATRLSSRPDRFTCHLSTKRNESVAPRTRINDTREPREPTNSPARSYAKRQTDSRPRFPTSERLTCARISKWRLLLPGIHWRSHSQFPVRYDSYGQRRPYTPRHRFR